METCMQRLFFYRKIHLHYLIAPLKQTKNREEPKKETIRFNE